MGYTINDVKRIIDRITDVIIAEKAELTEIDSKLGDGDMGMSMEKGALALKKVLSEEDEKQEEDISRLLLKCAASFNRAAPSTMGTLLSGGMMALAKEWGQKAGLTVNDIIAVPDILARSIALRGKASVGDKTVLDALCPYAEELKKTYENTKDIEQALKSAALAAERGMEGTRGIIAKTGRAKWLAERNMDCPDGGAVLCYRIGKSFIDKH